MTGTALDAVPRLIDAIAFAADRHRNQRRKDADATPYINHPLALARVLSVEGGVTDVSTILAAVLHDTIEDTETEPADLVQRFGEEVAAVVAEVTDNKKLLKSRRKELQVEHAPHLSTRAKAVKLADKICNLRDVADSPPKDWPLARRQEYFDWAKSVVDGLRGEHPTLERIFDRAYEQRPTENATAESLDEGAALELARVVAGTAAELLPCEVPSPAPYGFTATMETHYFFRAEWPNRGLRTGPSDYVVVDKRTGEVRLVQDLGE